ncbi:MAG TPA: PAC2 family protein [Acidimicrobiales bacterium]|nr:PAC2 family protein [Acidimicrobiales bacterium]
MSPEERSLYQVELRRTFKEPVLVISLDGWVDAGLGSATAVAALLAGAYDDDVLITFDGDHFLDQRARRPVAHVVNGVTTELTWPKTQIRIAKDLLGNDMLFLIGPEPDFHWRGFVDAVVEIARTYGVRLAVAFGAFPAPAPHTRPVKLAATAPERSQELVARVGVVQGELEVPAGVSAALELGFGAAGIDAITLWARVPHYVAAMPYPDASAALVDGLAALSGLALDSSGLRRAAESSRRQVDEVIAGNPQHLAMVHKLEATLDASEGNPLGLDDLPSGDEIAAELERFLRGEDQ